MRFLPAAFAVLVANVAPAAPPKEAISRPASTSDPAARAMPPFEALATPGERPVLDSLLASLRAGRPADTAAILVPFDAALARLTSPTPLRASVQMARAGLLQDSDRQAEAIAAVEEAVRLLPDYSAPLILAAHILTYSDHPERAADSLARAADLDPVSVRQVDDYLVDGLISRLSDARDRRRRQIVADKLLAAGWLGNGVGSRSALALVAIEGALEQGDIASARRLVPNLVAPDNSYRLLALKVAQPIWADIAAWSGERLEKAWPLYLAEARARWSAAHDLERSRDYAKALRMAENDRELIATFTPVLAATHDRSESGQLVFVVTNLAWANMKAGHPEQAIAVFDRALAIWPLGSESNALNVAANRGKYLIEAGRPAEGLAQLDLAIADARRRGPEVNREAYGMMHGYRACALHLLGRLDEVAPSLAIATSIDNPGGSANAYLCVEDLPSARRVLIDALADPAYRARAITYLQPPGPPDGGPFNRKQHDLRDALRRDPAVVAALSPYGRILPFALSDSAPPPSVPAPF